jgi:DNA-binding transcriptional MerR regulator
LEKKIKDIQELNLKKGNFDDVPFQKYLYIERQLIDCFKETSFKVRQIYSFYNAYEDDQIYKDHYRESLPKRSKDDIMELQQHIKELQKIEEKLNNIEDALYISLIPFVKNFREELTKLTEEIIKFSNLQTPYYDFVDVLKNYCNKN